MPEIHPTSESTVSNNTLGDNVLIGPYCCVNDMEIGNGSKLFKFVNAYKSQMGENTKVGAFTEIQDGVKIGNNTTISSHSFLCGLVEVGDEVFIGHGVRTINDLFPPSRKRTGSDKYWKPTYIGKNTIIGTDTTLMPVRIGEYAFVGAKSLVTKDIPAGQVWAGHPARYVKDTKDLTYDDMEKVFPDLPDHLKKKVLDEAKKIKLMDLRAQYQELKPQIDQAISEVIDSTQFIGGSNLSNFEKNFASFCEKEHCIATSSGSTALYTVLKVLGIKEGDEVIIPVNTFIATAFSVTLTGAKPVFVDVNPSDSLMNPDLIEQAITSKTKAIIPVHLYGNVCDMTRIKEIADKHSLEIVEDCAQAHGSYYKERPVPITDIGCFSFFPAKNLGAFGDAGAIVCNNPTLATKFRKFVNHGRQEKYLHDTEGFNFRCDPLQAAVLDIKLAKLKEWTLRKMQVAEKYNRELNIKKQSIPEYVQNSFHLYVIQSQNRDALQQHLKERDIESGIHYPVPLHLQPAFSFLNHKSGDFPVAESLAKEILSIPIHPHLSEEDQQKVISAINSFQTN